ncbi:LysR substrate-binding domain-containing protein, partial [Thalassovita aquimarina]
NRTPTGLELNAAGRTLFTFVNAGLQQVDRGFDALREELEDRHISAYVLPNVMQSVMPGAVRRFKAQYPDIDLRFAAIHSGQMAQQLRDGGVEFGFGRMIQTEQMRGMNFEYLYSEPLIFFTRPGHPLASTNNLTVHDLDRFQVVLPSQKTIIRAEIDRFAISQGLPRFSSQIETLSPEFTRAYVMMSDAIAAFPLGAMRDWVNRGEIMPLDIGGDQLIGSVGITTMPDKVFSAPTDVLVQAIRNEVHDQGLS